MTLRTQLAKTLIICGAGVSAHFLASSFELKPIEKMFQITAAQASDTAGMGQIRERFRGLQGSRECEAARRRSLEVAPELLALAAWPLDDGEPTECRGVAHDTIASNDDILPAMEITEALSVVAVMASEYGVPVPSIETPLFSPLMSEQKPPLGEQLAALDTVSLDEVRGGFELDGSGLKFSFGIERAVFINGELIASTSLNLKDLKLTAGAGSAPVTLPPGATGALGVIQNGPGNNVSAAISPNLPGTIIQNTLNDQKIQNVTTINASVNSMQAVRAMSVQSAIQSGIVSSLRR